jgi:hypothetical protein
LGKSVVVICARFVKPTVGYTPNASHGSRCVTRPWGAPMIFARGMLGQRGGGKIELS